MTTQKDQRIIDNYREDNEKQAKTIESLRNALTNCQEERNDLKEELNHYRTAVAAVKWLWDQAQNRPPFQL